MLLAAALLLGLAAFGPAQAPAQAQNTQIREITGIGESESFPLRSGIFTRTLILAYGAGMEDISIGYNSAAGRLPAATTVYLYPVRHPAANDATTLEREFEEVKQLMGRFPGGQWVEPRSAVTVAQPAGAAEGLMATYRYEGSFRGRPVELFTLLHLFLEGDRWVKFRHTFPVEDADTYRAGIAELMAALKWQGIDAANVAARLGQGL